MIEYNCRVCGFNIFPDEFWEDESPTYLICPCCGCESGNDDYKIDSIKQYRDIWISKGAKWFNPKEIPEDWHLEEQLEKIPTKFR
ncbi:hypothetical protein [Epilithonimonas hungarica]|uniref:Rubredoxin-like domain-containing protein n=1 Tax=Epilithonimonas hungarica TaxID=454006 RepID=A0A1G7W2E1_9FLAO|nr:hypothetical protein [Epilithonimonas hungarica]SDG66041.1 hypothetical protein SAMN05421825_3783 [Epilithonimonas hungarica]